MFCTVQEVLDSGSICGNSDPRDVVEGVSGWAANPAQKGKNVETRNLATRMN